jgi:CRP/FNR family transcriptional regulator, cyclic AMP receptor protein
MIPFRTLVEETGESVVGFEIRFRAVLCTCPIAGLKYSVQHKFHRESFTGPGGRIRYLSDSESCGGNRLRDRSRVYAIANSHGQVERLFRRKEAFIGRQAKDLFDPKIFLAKVGAGKTMLEFRKNQSIFAQGDVANAVFYIQKGRVKLTVLSEQGKEAVVAILEPGQFFGEGCLNGYPLRIATTAAMEECLITSITKEAMIALLHTEPKFSEMFMAYLLKRNSRVEEDLIDQLFNSSEKRLARLLLLLAHFGKEGSPQPINPSIS